MLRGNPAFQWELGPEITGECHRRIRAVNRACVTSALGADVVSLNAVQQRPLDTAV